MNSVDQNVRIESAEPLVGVVVVNWNGWEDTFACLESLKKSRHRNWAMFVVDNASTDESLARLRSLGSEIRLVESPANLGFAGGCNLGVAAARADGVDYLYFLNNDAFVDPDTIGQFVAMSRDLKDRAVLGSVIRRESDGSIQFWGSGRDPRWGGPDMFESSEERLSHSDDLIDTDFIVGASMFVPVSVFENVGPFDDRFFLLFEEADWCYRARALGYRCAIMRDAVVRHQDGASIGGMASPMRIYFVRRNRLLFCEKNSSPNPFMVVLARQIVGAIARRLASAITNRGASATYSKINWMATWDYIHRRFGDCPTEIRTMTSASKTAH